MQKPNLPKDSHRGPSRGKGRDQFEKRSVPLSAGRGRGGKKDFALWKRPELELQTTTLWDYPSQHYGYGMQGHKEYVGATPSYVIWNLVQRYTSEGQTVVDPMCGSGTTLDVCQDLGRKGIGFDVAPFRPDIQAADARSIPQKAESVDLVFIDPPYSTHVDYSEDPRCIGKLDSRGSEYFVAMEKVIRECHRILKPGGHFAIYVCDSFKKGKPFSPIGFQLFDLAAHHLDAVDIVCVTRHNKSLKKNHWHTSAVEGNYFLRGFNYLLIFKKQGRK